MSVAIYGFDGAFKTHFERENLKDIKDGSDIKGLGAVTVSAEGSGYTDAERDASDLLTGTGASLTGGGKGRHEFDPVWYLGVSAISAAFPNVAGAGKYKAAPSIVPTFNGYNVETLPTFSVRIRGGNNRLRDMSITKKGEVTIDPEAEEQSISWSITRAAADNAVIGNITTAVVLDEANTPLRLNSISITSGGFYGVAPRIRVIFSGYNVIREPTVTATINNNGAITAITANAMNGGRFTEIDGATKSITIEVIRDPSDDATQEVLDVISLTFLNYLKNLIVGRRGGGYTGTPKLTFKAPASGTAAAVTFALTTFKSAALDLGRNADLALNVYGPEFVSGMMLGTYFANGVVETKIVPTPNHGVIIREEF